ncbi:MAG: mechanosensitive ion channel domain-containing protein [Pseudomonadota bacterium]
MSWWLALFSDVMVAGAIILVALSLSGLAARTVRGLADRFPELDETLFGFLASLARYAILAFAAIFVLGRFGIETTSLVALVGAAGLAIGLALQGTLSNMAAGVMLLVFRPFKIGDFIDAAGQSGTVAEISLFTTELTTPDNVQIIVPNGDIWSSAITNYSHHETRRVDLTFGVAYDADLRQVEEVLQELIEADTRIHDAPEPFVKVAALGDSAVEFVVRVWCESEDYWGVKFDLTRAAKEKFDEAGIDIPFPTRRVLGEA